MESIIRNIKVKEPAKCGQALTELAIFGSIFLFCLAMLIQYGLEANYQQQAQMEAFRKAQKLAYHKTGPNSSASLILVKDKPFVDPRDQWGFAERSPVMASASVTWGTDLSSTYVKKFNDPIDARDLPAVYLEVEGVDKTAAVNVKDANGNNTMGPHILQYLATAYVPKGAEAEEGKAFGFYTARMERRACPPVITVFFEDPTHNHPLNTEHREYYIVRVKKEDIKVMRIEGGFGDDEVHTNYDLVMYPYFRSPDGLKRRIDMADIDGDGQLENIIAANENKELLYVDYHDPKSEKNPGTPLAGDIQIDSDAQVYPWDKVCVERDGSGNCIQWRDSTAEDRQGMVQDFDKTITHRGSKIVKTETAGVITSHTELKATQRIIHKFRLNNGQVVEIPVEFNAPAPDGGLYKWQ